MSVLDAAVVLVAVVVVVGRCRHHRRPARQGLKITSGPRVGLPKERKRQMSRRLMIEIERV